MKLFKPQIQEDRIKKFKNYETNENNEGLFRRMLFV